MLWRHGPRGGVGLGKQPPHPKRLTLKRVP
jgi:hypothetical protein